MLVLNKLSKVPFYIGLSLLILIQSYATGLLFGGTGLSLILAVWSAVKPLPAWIYTQLWLVYLLAGIPTGLYVLVFVARDVIKSKKHNKQDN